MASARRKVMVIGLDGLSLPVLLPLAEAGALPTFSSLLRRGAYGTLRSVGNMSTGVTWASFATGCGPERHGILHDFHHQPEDYSLRPTRGSDRRAPAFWQAASAAGRASIVLNAPHTYPAQPLRGALLCGIDAPGERAPGFDYPPGTYRALRRRGVDYLIDCGLASYVAAGRIAEGAAAVERETEGRTRAAEALLERIDWDLLVVVYSLPDVWQHYYWSALGPGEAAGRALIHDGYRLLDAHLARLLAHLPQDGVAIVCSDHGFGPLCGTRDHLNHWLAEQGLLRYEQAGPRGLGRKLAQAALAEARRRVSFRARQQWLARFPRLRRRVETHLRLGGIDWPHTRVYAAIDHQELWLNVRGRQAQGCVDPAAAERLADEVRAALLAWRDPRSGLPYLRAVERRPASAAPPGALAPDLLLTWNPAAAAPRLHPLISGDHHPEGALIVAGAGVAPRRLEERSLLDIAPLALRALGVPAPPEMEGRAEGVIE